MHVGEESGLGLLKDVLRCLHMRGRLRVGRAGVAMVCILEDKESLCGRGGVLESKISL